MANVMKSVANEKRNSKKEVIVSQFWSSVLIATSAAQNILEFFKTTTGGKAVTNMDQAGQIPGGWNFDIYDIFVKFFNNDGKPFFVTGNATPTAHPLNLMTATGWLDFYRGQSLDFSSHLLRFFDPFHLSNDGATTSIGTGVHKANDSIGRVRLKHPITILGGSTFSAKLTFTAPTTGAAGFSTSTTYAMVMIEGELVRPR